MPTQAAAGRRREAQTGDRMSSTPWLVAGWDTPLGLCRAEAIQCGYEGRPVPRALRDALDAADADDTAAIERIAAQLAALPPDPAFPYLQPDGLEAIRAQRPPPPQGLPRLPADDLLLDRFHGAWAGRAAGCALGKPVEMLGMFGSGGRRGRACIEDLLRRRGEWPLRDYFAGSSDAAQLGLFCPLSWRENIAFLEADDDIHYSLIALDVLERLGERFGWADIADTWNERLPYASICTAETQAILNYNLRTARKNVARGIRGEVTPEFTRRHNNPYREWIGAQIRADVWGYACAGDPARAAALAWRDASWTHSANGIYAAMMSAAMVAAAFVETDLRRLVAIGLAQIPRNCRLAEAVHKALGWLDECPAFDGFMQRHEAEFGHLHPTHAVNNALVVIMALHYGAGELDRTVATAVMAGLDTDSNGATAGSIAGARLGRQRLGSTLVPRLNDTIRPHMVGIERASLADLAARTLAVHRRLRAAA